MMEFWIAALALGLVAAALVLVPVLRAWSRGEETRTGSTLGVAVVLALAVPIAAVLLYSRWTTWDWSGDAARAAQAETEETHAMDEAVAALVARLQREPNDVEGWRMLGRSYMSMRRFDDAAGAFRQALDVAAGEPPDIMADLGEAMALSDPQGLQGGAGALIERVLELSPTHPKGLWYGGIYAYENRDFATSVDRLTKLLQMNPPESLVPLIEERIAEARAHADVDPAMFAGAGSQETGNAAPVSEAAAAEAPVGEVAAAEAPDPEPEPAPQPAPAETGNGIPVQVTLDPALQARLNPAAPLFLIARNPAGGPPLAVIRRSGGELPFSVELTNDNVMMQGMTILDQPALGLVARVSLSGSPAAQPGDLYGEVTYQQGSGPVQITIDRVVE